MNKWFLTDDNTQKDTKMEYLLVEVCDRKISIPICFKTWEEANAEMCRRVEEALNGSFGDMLVSGYEASVDCNGKKFDWKIFSVNDINC